MYPYPNTIYKNPFVPNIIMKHQKKTHSRLFHQPIEKADPVKRIREIAERHLLYDLAELSSRTKQEDLYTAVSGGIAVRAYSGPVRFTHDVDMVVSERAFGALKRIFKGMGYRGDRKNFGKGEIAFMEKKIQDKRCGVFYNLAFDVSIGGIFDHSSGILYPADPRLFLDSRTLPVRGFYPSSASILISAKVLGLEDLFILKTITKATLENGREKDSVDALLLALKNPPDIVRLWSIAKTIGISDYVESQVREKLLTYLDAPSPVALASYEISFSENERNAIRGMLTSIISNKPVTVL